jgi:hypothetical protein
MEAPIGKVDAAASVAGTDVADELSAEVVLVVESVELDESVGGGAATGGGVVVASEAVERSMLWN